MWQYVDDHFQQFLAELELQPKDHEDAQGKALRVAKSLHAFYYPDAKEFDPACYQIVGSYGKGTAALPRTDIDMLFILPWSEWATVDGRIGNKQSQLLQQVKNALADLTFTTSDIHGDGPVVIVNFWTYKVEVVPCFLFDDGRIFNAHTKDGGKWMFGHPTSELNHLNRADTASKGMARDLIKMLKAWKETCNVTGLRSICLEIAAVVFIEQWDHRGQGIGFYDHMVRDFFQFLLQYVNGQAKPAGVDDWIELGDCWQTRAQSAYDRAYKACHYEEHDDAQHAVEEWQKIFGAQFKGLSMASLLAGLI